MVSELIRINKEDPKEPSVGGGIDNPSTMPVFINLNDVKAIQFKDGKAVIYFRDGSKPQRVKDSPQPSKALQQQLRAANLLQADNNTFVNSDAVVAIFASRKYPPAIVLDSGERFETQNRATLRALAERLGLFGLIDFELSDAPDEKDRNRFIKLEAIKLVLDGAHDDDPSVVVLNKDLSFPVSKDAAADLLCQKADLVRVSDGSHATFVNPLQVKSIVQKGDQTHITFKGDGTFVDICGNKDLSGTVGAINRALQGIAEAAKSPSQGTHGRMR